MSRDYKVFLDDILKAINKIQKYTINLSFEDFSKSELIIDAVIRNFEIIGEAIKNIPDDLKQRVSKVEWKKIVGFRDILIHQYFGISINILWDVIQNKLELLKDQINSLLSSKK